ncbi:hypothetical protein D9757_013606 [Collybiopsis confluens]|uniref:C2H2-type domain-containing protein n=1 Tax=Collybiopsis confluens TaxID=2823264 RepID=A0A8H5GA49_9AGAR|nr:hypothetical protein D9757_013606 [Collybiopsis confluens]
MEFECRVCQKRFANRGNRDRHIKTKQDQGHQAYYEHQIKAQAAQISRTFTRVIESAIPSGQLLGDRVSEHNDITTNDTTTSSMVVASNDDELRNATGSDDNHSSDSDMAMDIDTSDNNSNSDDSDSDLDDSGSLCSWPADFDQDIEPDDDFQEDLEKKFKETYNMMDIPMESTSKVDSTMDMDLDYPKFNFLPYNYLSSSELQDSDFNDEEASDPSSDVSVDELNDPGSAEEVSAPYRKMDRTLAEDEDEPRTWWWHPTAAEIVEKKSNIHQQWKSIFLENDARSPYNTKGSENAYYPFTSRLDWEIAEWAVKEKISQKSFNRLLKIPQVHTKLGLSYTNSRSMLKLVDEIPDKCGTWFTKQLSFRNCPDEHFTVHYRDPIEAIKSLWGDPALAEHLVYKPGKLFFGPIQSEENRIFSEMWTGGFWNAVQNVIPKGGTVCPVIIATDKTQLTRFAGNKAAYPVYLTIGNIPKALRRKPSARACVLIAYLSVDKPARGSLSKQDIKLRNYEIFHCSMAHVLNSLKTAGNPKGKGVRMIILSSVL